MGAHVQSMALLKLEPIDKSWKNHWNYPGSDNSLLSGIILVRKRKQWIYIFQVTQQCSSLCKCCKFFDWNIDRCELAQFLIIELIDSTKSTWERKRWKTHTIAWEIWTYFPSTASTKNHNLIYKSWARQTAFALFTSFCQPVLDFYLDCTTKLPAKIYIISGMLWPCRTYHKFLSRLFIFYVRSLSEVEFIYWIATNLTLLRGSPLLEIVKMVRQQNCLFVSVSRW